MITNKGALKEAARRASTNTARPIELNANFPKQNALINDTSRYIAAQCSRRAGKCRIAGTLVKTPTGSVSIEKLVAGDTVYGYNLDGTVSPCKVVKLYDQGIQIVVDLIHSNTIVATSTVNHRWLAHNTFSDRREIKELKNFNARDKVATEYIKAPGGTKNMPIAYSLGAFLGDGCSRDNGLHISSNDQEIVDAVALELNLVSKRNPHNYTHALLSAKKLELPFYEDWCHNRYAHEKTCDLAEIRTWNRQSQLRFLAGLIDTDGSVWVTADNTLVVNIGMQARAVIETVQALLLDLFQIQCKIEIDARSKYKNGPVYYIRVKNNLKSKRILRELPNECHRKQWRTEYEDLNENNTNPKYIGIDVSAPYEAQCYDIEIDNDSHLFLDANGMIGHNTNGLAYRFFKTMEKYPKSQCIYLGHTRDSAKGAIWPVLQEINEKYGLGCTFLESKLQMKHPNGATLIILGADMANYIKRLRGRKFPGIAIDESQDFSSHIESLVDDVLTPSISDYTDGWLAITGTPGPVPQGYFFDVTVQKKYGFSLHGWTLYENPNMPDPQAFVADLKQRKGWPDDNPTLQREWLNKWVLDLDALWIRYKADQNHYTELPKGHKWNHVMGVDIGFKDADAIAVLAWSETSPQTYLVHEQIDRKQGISDLVQQIDRLQKQYDVYKIVMDEGGLGKKIGEEIRRRFACPLEPADKANKQDNVEFLNDDLRLGKFMAKSASRFAQDSYMVRIDWDKSTPKRIILKAGFHSDIIDAVLYAFRESYAFTHKPEAPKLQYGSREWAEATSAEMFERELAGHIEAARIRDEQGDY